MGDPVPLLAKLSAFAAAKGDRAVHTWLEPDGREGDAYTFGALARRSDAVAALVGARLAPGDRALLCYEPGLDFLVAFYGCLKAGVVAVPVFPPDPRRPDAREARAFAAIGESCGAAVALTAATYRAAAGAAASLRGFASLRGMMAAPAAPKTEWVATDAAAAVAAFAARDEPRGLAFLQYTSGSTSVPKGVMIATANLAHNLALITAALGSDETTVCVSWLPQYHDMGLIGSFLGTLYCGGRGYHSSPLAFVRDPTRWLRDVTKRVGPRAFSLSSARRSLSRRTGTARRTCRRRRSRTASRRASSSRRPRGPTST